MTDRARRAGYFLLMAALGFLSACTTMPVESVGPETEFLWSLRQAHIDPVHAWQASGRLGIQSEREGWSVSFRWEQQPGSYRIVLSAPLGQQSAELIGEAGDVTLLLADGRRASAASAEDLLMQQLGWRIPVQGLYFWVRGLPAQGAEESHALDAQGRLIWLKQAGWNISYLRYGEFSDMNLPTKIFLDNERFKVRLVIDDWTLL